VSRKSVHTCCSRAGVFCPICLFLTVLYCRSLRVVLFGFQVLSAGVAFVIGSTQLVSALANAPRHLPLQEVAQVSLGAISLAKQLCDIPLLYAHPHAAHILHDSCHSSSVLSILQGLAIDAAGIGIFGWLLKRDLDARDKQIARMTREEDLGSLQIELANKKTLRLAQLRQFVRIVSRLLLLHFQYLCCVAW
jgi:hypothetical protein